jgi:hypothetical protein
VLHGNRWRGEPLAILFGQLTAAIDKTLQTVGVDELDEAAGPDRGTDAHDRADVAVVGGTQHIAFQAL